jgi:hypothetical protein
MFNKLNIFEKLTEKAKNFDMITAPIVISGIALVALSNYFEKDNTPDFGPNAPAIKMTSSGGKLILEQNGKSYSLELSKLKPEQIEKLAKLNPEYKDFLNNGPINVIDVNKKN